MLRFLFTMVGILFSMLIFGQPEILYVNKIPSEKGLSQTTNSFLNSDKNGYIWIGSLDGANLFDGKTTKVFKSDFKNPFSLKGVNIQSSFFQDQEDNIWFTTNEAINSYQKEKGIFKHYFAGESKTPSHHYAFHLEHQKFLWLASNNNLYRFNTAFPDSSLQPIMELPFAARCDVGVDENGKVKTIFNAFWNIRKGFEVIQFSDSYEVESRQVWFDKIGHPADFPLITYEVLAEQNSAWLATDRGLLYFPSKQPENFKLYPLPEPNLKIVNICKGAKNTIYVLLKSSEILVFDKTKQEFLPQAIRLYDLKTKSKLNNIGRIFSPQNNIIWASVNGEGIYFGNTTSKGFVSPFDKFQLSKYPISHIFEMNDGKIICTSIQGTTGGNGIKILFDRNQNLVEENPFRKYFKSIRSSDGNNWNVSERGLNNSLVEEDYELEATPQDVFQDLIDYNQQYLILGTNQGIVFFDKKNNTTIPTAHKNWTVKLFLDHQNRLWSADVSNTLRLWKINNNQLDSIELIKTFSNVGLINDIIEDTSRQAMWVGTSKGLTKIDTKTLDKQQLTENDGLPNQYIQSILLVKKSIWLSSNKGIIQYQPEEKLENRFAHYTARDGLRADEYLPDAAILAKDGKLWFGNTKGADVIDPKNIRAIGQPPQLAINSLKIHDKEWGGDTMAINSVTKINLDHDENTLVFDLAALEYTDPDRNQFKVFLKYENKIDTTFLNTKNTINYANLSPGKYLFQFTASNAEGVWQEESRDLEIVIAPPFHQTWWFRTLVLLALIALVSFISSLYYRIQLRAKALELEKQEREAERKRLVLEKTITLQNERTRIAGEMHDEIGSGLSTIRYASSSVGKRNTMEEVKKVMNRVSQISINLIKNMRGIIWAMDPDFDSLEDLCAYIRRDSKEYLDDNDLKAEINIPSELPTIVMSGPARHNIALVVKETLHNIVKHAEATIINFDLTIVDDELKIKIKDDGKGFDMDQLTRRGHGLRNMTRRMKTIEGKVDWKRLFPKGMQVLITLPLSKKKTL